MKLDSLPDIIQAIVVLAGDLELRGAFVYVGAHAFSYRCPEPTGEYRSRRSSRLATEVGQGSVDYEVALQARVNRKQGHCWMLIIACEPNNIYSVWLVEARRGRKSDTMVLACERDVSSDTLQGMIEAVYDRAIREHNAGFIPLD